MKKIVLFLLGVMLTSVGCQAETLTKWHGYDTVTLGQSVSNNIPNATKVYLYAHSTAQRKNDNSAEKQDAALKDLPNVMQPRMSEVFPKAQVILVSSPSEAGSDGLFVNACLTQIDWGDGAVRTVVGLGAGGMWGYFDVKVSNANGLIYEMQNRRYRSTALSSAKGAAVIAAFNKELVRDFIDLTKTLLSEGK